MTLVADPTIMRQALESGPAAADGLIAVCSTRDWSGLQTYDIDEAIAWVMDEDKGAAEGIYVRVTTVSNRLPAGKRGSARDTHALVDMWSDIDFGNMAHKAKGLPETAEEARDIPRFAGLPAPTRVDHSGAGLYVRWALEKPLVVGVDIDFDAAQKLASDWQNALVMGAKKMGVSYGAGVKDLARVLRLPGSINRKPGRVPVMCQIIESGGPTYSLEQMLTVAEKLNPKPRPKPTAAARSTSSGQAAAKKSYQGAGPLEILGNHPSVPAILSFAGASYGEQAKGACPMCTGGECEWWLRAGWDAGCSPSGISVHKGGFAVTVRSDNAGVPDGGLNQVLSPGQLFAWLHHNGDQSAAARDILAASRSDPAATAAALALPADVLAEIKATKTVPEKEAARPEPAKDDEPSSPKPDSTEITRLSNALIEQLGTYMHLKDTGYLKFSLAVGVSSELDGDPLWGMVVGAPSGGKTEGIRVQDTVAEEHVDDITGPALLSWTQGKNPRPTGILSRVGSRAFVTISDFSTILATSDRGGRDTLFALLRRAFDGEVIREVGNSPEPLKWTGRLTLLAAVTPAIDNFSSHTDALGPRWLYFRLPETDQVHKKATVTKRRRIVGLVEKQLEAQRLGAQLVRAARRVVRDVELADETYDYLEDAAMLTCFGRAAVPRHAYGKREIDGIPVIEEPARITSQIVALAKSLVALGETTESAVELARKAALDTVPQARLKLLELLADGEELTAAEAGRRTGIHRHVARRALEEMEVVGLVVSRRSAEDDTEESDYGTPNPWRLGEEAELVMTVFNAKWDTEHLFDEGSEGAARSVGCTIPSPQKEEEKGAQIRTSETTDGGASHTSCREGPEVSPVADSFDLWDGALEDPDDFYAYGEL